jgi:hypothetical protein
VWTPPRVFASVNCLLNPVKHRRRIGAGFVFPLTRCLISSCHISFLVFVLVYLDYWSLSRIHLYRPWIFDCRILIDSSGHIRFPVILLTQTRYLHPVKVSTRNKTQNKGNRHSITSCAVLEPSSPAARSRLLGKFQECAVLLHPRVGRWPLT